MRLLLTIAALLTALGAYLLGWGVWMEKAVGLLLLAAGVLQGLGALLIWRRQAAWGFLCLYPAAVLSAPLGVLALFGAHRAVAAWPRDRFGRLRSTGSSAPRARRARPSLAAR